MASILTGYGSFYIASISTTTTLIFLSAPTGAWCVSAFVVLFDDRCGSLYHTIYVVPAVTGFYEAAQFMQNVFDIMFLVIGFKLDYAFIVLLSAFFAADNLQLLPSDVFTTEVKFFLIRPGALVPGKLDIRHIAQSISAKTWAHQSLGSRWKFFAGMERVAAGVVIKAGAAWAKFIRVQNRYQNWWENKPFSWVTPWLT